MRSDDALASLKAEFQELNDPEINLRKEIYAHFGLLSMKFGLVEHSLINSVLLYFAIQKFRTSLVHSKEVWDDIFDRCEVSTMTLTVGNLVRKLLLIEEFSDLKDDLSKLRAIRNYFAHQFMRNECHFFSSEDGCWLLLEKISETRHWVALLEVELQKRFNQMCIRLKIPLPDSQSIDALVDIYIQDAHRDLSSGVAKVGWDTDAL